MAHYIDLVTTKGTFMLNGEMKTVRQDSGDINNDWGVDRIIVCNTLTPTTPPTVGETVAMIRQSEFMGLYDRV